MHQRLITYVSRIFYGLVVASVILAGSIVLLSIFPGQRFFHIFVVQSGSMMPTIKTGAIVIVRPQTAYTTGDIITFGADTAHLIPTTHRIVAMRVQGGVVMYTTKGDANNAPDTKEIPQSEVIGKVRLNAPYIGYLIYAVKKPYGFLALLIVPSLFIIIDESRKIAREFKTLKQKSS